MLKQTLNGIVSCQVPSNSYFIRSVYVGIEPLHPVVENEELPRVDVNRPRATRTRKAHHTDVCTCS